MEVEERRREIAELIAKVGVWNVNASELGRKYGVSHTMIQKDIETILKETVPSETVISLQSALEPYFKKAIKKANELMDSHNETIQAKGVNALTSAIKEYLNFVGSYNLQERENGDVSCNRGENETIKFLIVGTTEFLDWCKENKHPEVRELFDSYCKEKETKPVRNIDDLPDMSFNQFRGILKSEDKPGEQEKTESEQDENGEHILEEVKEDESELEDELEEVKDSDG